MILTDRQIKRAIAEGKLIVDPHPRDDQYSPTALDLHVSGDFRRFKPHLYQTKGLAVHINLDQVQVPDLEPHMEQLDPEHDGRIALHPGELILATTLERVSLPAHGKIAARVEGRSRFARLGLVVHMTAPTIHNTFDGQITLEIMNHGPIQLRVSPRETRICQLIFARVEEEPDKSLASFAQGQTTPLGGAQSS